MSSAPYAMVRGSIIRITALDSCGEVPDELIRYAVSKCVTKVKINEVVEASKSETQDNSEDERRLHFTKPGQLVHYTAGIDFLKVDPAVLSIVAGVPLVYGESTELGFGEMPFGEGPFGGPNGNVVGFESVTHGKAVAFALEVWSKLAGQQCVDGQQMWGYSLFPYLHGGYLSGFEFSNGLVSFNLLDAQTRRRSGWGIGPHDLSGLYERLLTPVSRNMSFRTFITSAAPPAYVAGIQEFVDVLDNGTAANPMPDPDAALIVDGGGAITGPFTIDGGQAA